MKQFLCELILSCVLGSPGVKPIDELTYGTVLYAYYQDDYQQALLETMVAESQGRRGSDPIRFDLASGSFAFNERMYELSRETFAGVDPGELTDLDRMRLAFHLAREYHRRGDHAGMSRELEKIEFTRNWRGKTRRHPEVEFMRAEVALAAGRLDEAEALLVDLDEDDVFRAYGLFNLGIAYRMAGRGADAGRLFGMLAEGRAMDPESVDLRQRARLALAVIAREQGALKDASGLLGDLPGRGRYRDAALAAYGDLAMDVQDYQLAARIWLTLRNQPHWSRSTAQARLAYPVSLESLAAHELALEQYRQAETSFEERLALLDTLSRQAEDPAWVHGLLRTFSAPDRDSEKMADVIDAWQSRLGHTDWLEWLAAEETHDVLMEWRELLGMQEWLSLLPMTVAALEEVAAERRRRSGMARELVGGGALPGRRTELRDRLDAGAATLAALEGSQPEPTPEWMFHLATDEERSLIEELAAQRALVEKGMDGGERSRWLERIDRLEGLVFWRIADSRARRVRELVRQQQETELLLADVDSRMQRAEQAEGEFVAGVETDFMVFTDRADSLAAEVNSALKSREVALASQLKRGMAKEREEVQRYLLAARVGIARATDHLAADPVTMEGE
jgi:tetratricopeptide (TPR) repeat protein